MSTNALLIRYLVYDADGAGLVYSGTDQSAYVAARQRLGGSHAGALVGQCMAGPERWIVASFHGGMPDEAFIKRRRERGLFGLVWEPAGATALEE